ncbi:hypothetical protein [Pelagicoccus sp. SDUM812002]|uniref:hypothetical protein n=1 Tax=Pelagicoccus sp. SDUM812002 TaxID=3041266 RepID=UPI002810208D|nr:hypothetical protein [Pelagicoccus sp. SDUM812002]MDQ8186996.1 hypothetical protein [Pelagicoccus sp. SDUM812002]
MFLKAIIWGLLLCGVAILGNETQQRYLAAKLNAEHYQDTPLGIHKSGTILKFTAKAEFEFPLLPAITAAYENGFSDSLIHYLSHHHQKVVSYWETPPELRFELDRLTNRLIKERVFTVVEPITGQRHDRFQILPESEEYYFAYAYENGNTFYEEEKYDSYSYPICGLMLAHIDFAIYFEETPIGVMYSCDHWNQAPTAPELTVALDKAEPDLSTDFLRILANPDPTVY